MIYSNYHISATESIPLRLPNTSRSPLPQLPLTPLPPRPRRTPRIKRFPPPHKLIIPIQLHLNRTPHLERANSRPYTSLPAQNPVLQALLRGRLQQLQEIAGAEVRNEGHARSGDALVDEEAADGCWEEA